MQARSSCTDLPLLWSPAMKNAPPQGLSPAWKQGAPVSNRLMTAQELADYLGVSRWSVYRWNSLGTGPRRIKAGGVVRYRWADVEDWIEEESGRQN